MKLQNLFGVGAAWAVTVATQAQILVQSNFDSDAEGWTAISFGPVCTALTNPSAPFNTTWMATGGSTGGFLRTPDGNNNTTFWRAPLPYRGDHSAAYGGSIKFEWRLTTGDSDIYYALDDAYLIGGGLTLIADPSNPSRDSWGEARIPLRTGHWRVGTCTGPYATETQIRAVLADISELYIRAEHVNGGETNDLDSVALDAGQIDETCRASWDERDDAEPTGRWRHAVAVDTTRGVLVLFGGDTGENDTWEYSLATGVWTRVRPEPSPSRRGGHAMAFDAARQKIVMTGGGYAAALSEVWEYDVDADSWSLSDPLPQARSGHAMAYDTARQTLVLYGGLGAGVEGSVDVLERGPGVTSWTPRVSAVNPGPQIGYAMAYDESRGRTVLIGEGTTAVSVAEWDGVAGTWELRSFAGSVPAARRNPAVAFDAARSRIVLMGGQGNSSTWDYDGTTWTARAAISGGGRDEHAAAYDPVNSRVLLSGGILNNASPQRDLLAFDGVVNAWTTAWSRSACAPRDLHAMAYDEAGQRTLLYGGALVTRGGIVQQIGGGPFQFDGDGWEFLTATGDPGARWFAPLVYDPVRGVMLLYGGLTSRDAVSATARLWEFNPATLAWTDRGVQAPGQRYDHAAAFDRVRDRLVVHGGFNELGERIGGTWTYDPAANSWTGLPETEPSPGSRNGAAMAFDEHRGVVVLFGGRTGDSAAYDNSTWEWNGTAWADVTPPSGNPPARFRPNLLYDPNRQSVIMFGGVMNTNANNGAYAGRAFTDLWEWKGGGWLRIAQEPGERPIAQSYSNAAYDHSRARIVHFGGGSITNGTYRNGQTWDLILPPVACGGCPADWNDDAAVNSTDISAFLTSWLDSVTNMNLLADFNGDLMVTSTDISAFLTAWLDAVQNGC